ncbi:MAG: TolC family protein [Synechococcaceae cyanobacterium]|nr:TolC family protein [Synechococcaceae cyanobacterium]
MQAPSVWARQPTERTPAAVPGDQGPASTLAGLEHRLDRYRDHLERSARRLSLRDALALGLTQSPILAKAYAQIEATRWDGAAIRREWFPSLKAGNNDPGLVGVRQQQANTLSVSSPQLTLEWTFFDPSRAPRTNANAASLAADRFLFDVQARSLVLAIQQQYITLQTQLTLEKQYHDLSLILSDWRQLAQAKARRGATTPDVDQLTSQELALLVLRINTHEQAIVAASNLARSLSLAPGELVMPSEPLVLQGEWTLGRRETIAQALELREEIQQSLARARSLAWRAVATRRGYLPSLALEGLGSTTGNSGATGLNSEASVGVNVVWTLFDGGILAAQADAQGSQQEQAQQQAALDRLSVVAEVESSYATYLSSRIVVDTAMAQLASARASIAAATRGYQAGSSDATTLLQVLSDTRGAIEATFLALEKHNKSVAALYRNSARWPELAPPLLRQRAISRLTVRPG